jgi:hypothetical protein
MPSLVSSKQGGTSSLVTNHRCYASTSSTTTLVTTLDCAGYTSAAYPSLRLGAPTTTSRKLEEDIVHYKMNSWKLLRSEVAKAVQDILDGEVTSYQLNMAPETGEGVSTLTINVDGMEVSKEDLDERSQRGTLVNVCLTVNFSGRTTSTQCW